MSKVSLVQITPDPEKNMAYIARVSNPANQDNEDFAKLLSYCIKHHHWSVFEHASLTLEIETSLAIATQILRHRSFTFQQFSQRYANVALLEADLKPPELRRQDTKNRQNSISDLDPAMMEYFHQKILGVFGEIHKLYAEMVDAGVAKECARMVLPQATQTRLYMTGNARSWIHYIQLRTSPGTQKEHREVAEGCKKIFAEQFPTISEALGWL